MPDVEKSNRDTVNALKVAGAGAFGGFVFWILALYSKTVVFSQLPVLGQIGATAVLGIAAALVGVYLLTASDLEKTQTYVFAMVCGLIWQPVLKAGMETVSGVAIVNKAADVAAKTSQVNSAGTPQQASSTIQSATPSVIEAVKSLSSANSPDQQKVLTEQSGAAINAIKAAGAKAPEVSIDALNDVALQAVRSNQSAIANDAVQSLSSIGAKSSNPEIRLRVQGALLRLSQAAKENNVHGTASLAGAEAGKFR